jgi:hypothetical protein
MTTRWRATAAVLVCAFHLALFVPTIGDRSAILMTDFAPQAQAIKEGDLPYRDQEIEYPPLSIPVLIAPVYADDSTQGFVDGFMWEMLVFDLAIVIVIALALPGDAKRVLSALGVYTAGLLILSGIVLDESVIDAGPLALVRFDLVPALFMLCAVLARDRGHSGTWSALLAVGAGVKAFPLLLFPALLRGEQRLWRVAIAAAIPLLACAAIVVIWGDEFGSAIGYHTDRPLQVESLGATPFVLGEKWGADVTVVGGHGGLELQATGIGAVKWLLVVAGALLYVLLVWMGWRSSASNLELVTALVAVVVVFAPVLSPAAYGLRAENAVLLGAFVFTQLALQNYEKVENFGDRFVWPIAGRNLTLLIYLALVTTPILRSGSAVRARTRTWQARPDGPLSRRHCRDRHPEEPGDVGSNQSRG